MIRFLSFAIAALQFFPSFASELKTTIKSMVPNLQFSSDSKLWLEGDSTFHAYSSQATEIVVKGELLSTLNLPKTFADYSKQQDLPPQANGMSLIIPIKGLKSGTEGLDDNMYEALKEPEHPKIMFTLIDYKLNSKPVASGKSAYHKVRAKGRLSLAGVTRIIDLSVDLRLTKNQVHLVGQKQLKMTDFGISPPTFMFGMFSTADEIDIKFDLVFSLTGAS